jgi:hypothetical protein
MKASRLGLFLVSALIGVVFLWELESSASYCDRSVLERTVGGGLEDDKKCTSYEKCDQSACSNGMCEDEEDTVKCATTDGKAWKCVDQDNFECRKQCSETIKGKQCRCENEECKKQTSEVVECGTAYSDCQNY